MLVLLFSLLISDSVLASYKCDVDPLFTKTVADTAQVLTSELTDACVPLSVGKRKNLNLTAERSPTASPMAYQLQRISTDQYKVAFNIAWFTSGGDENTDRTLTESLRQETNACLRTVENLAKGPNGEKIIFEIADPNLEGEKPPLLRIKSSDIERSQANNWSRKIDCETKIHELLHLTGLVDEYVERNHYFKQDMATGLPALRKNDPHPDPENLAYDCRKIYQDNSIMALQHEEIKKAKGDRIMIERYCEGQPSVIKALEKEYRDVASKTGKEVYLKECPSNTKLADFEFKSVSTSDEEKAAADGKRVPSRIPSNAPMNRIIRSIRLVSWEKRDQAEQNFLAPRHFSSIVFPGCIAKNASYYQDARNAYKTSIKKGGEGCENYEWTAEK